MQNKKVIIFTLLILMLFLPVRAVRAEDSNQGKYINLFLEGVKVAPEITALKKEGIKYVNLPFLVTYLHMNADWDPEKGSVDLRLGKLNIRMNDGETEYHIGAKKDKLSHPLLVQAAQLWFPEEFILKFGLVTKNSEKNRWNLAWKENYLLAIENLKYQESPAFMLVGTKSMKLTGFVLSQPDRLVVEFSGVAHESIDTNIVNENPIVKSIRFHQAKGDLVRFVFDLNQAVGYKIIYDPEQKNQALIVFNYLVEDIKFSHRNSERKVFIKTSFPASYQIEKYESPNRLVIDFMGATLTGDNKPIPGDGEWISGVRMSQFNSQTVRVVLDLLSKQPYFVSPARDNPNLLEIRTIQSINQISWSETETGGQLTIDADGELVEKIDKLKEENRIRVELLYTCLSPGVSLPPIASQQIAGVQLVMVNENTVCLDLDLKGNVSFNSVFSEDRRKLVLNVKKSPLVGKTVFLDAGHGGVDPGACGRQGTREKEINLDVTYRLKELLEEAGANVVLSRDDDSFISLYERPFLANHLAVDLFISIHTNNHGDTSVRGIEVYYYLNRIGGKKLGQDVLKNILETTRLKNQGLKKNDFVVIRESQMPAVLVELGFLSNYQEERTLRSAEFRTKAARGIFQGILDYYNFD